MSFAVGMRVSFVLPVGGNPADWHTKEGWVGVVTRYWGDGRWRVRWADGTEFNYYKSYLRPADPYTEEDVL